MEPNGIFLNKSFQRRVRGQTEEQVNNNNNNNRDSIIIKGLSAEGQKLKIEEQDEPDYATISEVAARSTSSTSSSFQSDMRATTRRPSSPEKLQRKMTEGGIKNGNCRGFTSNNNQSNYCPQQQHHHHTTTNNHTFLAQESSNRSKNKRPLLSISDRMTEEELPAVQAGENRKNDAWNNNNNNNTDNYYYTIASPPPTSAFSAPNPDQDHDPSSRRVKKPKSKSGVQAHHHPRCNRRMQVLSHFYEEVEKDGGSNNDTEKNAMELVEEESSTGILAETRRTASGTAPQPQPQPMLTWKLPSFLCLPFTNNENNNSYFHLKNMSSNNKSAGILSLTSLLIVVIAVILASVPAPVMSATPANPGDSSLATDEIINNDVTSRDYPTTSSSITPVKLQTIQFTSPGDGTTPEDAALFLSSTATGRTTGGSSGPSVSVTHQTVEGLRQEPSLNDFAGWKDADTLNVHSVEMDGSSDKGDHHGHGHDDEEDLLHKEYEFKSGYPELLNETREALQEEGSNHQPVVFVGGSGYVPPNSIRTRPPLDDPLYRPLAETRYPVPLQSAWDSKYRNPFNMTRVQHIEAECQDDFMKIRVAFNGSFQGLIYSSGYSYDPDCVYVNGTGRDYYEYLIKLNRCGTLGASNHVEGRREPSKNFMWNTVTVQYNPMIEEEWDEHFKVTCEYGYDFWKTVTFPFLDVEVATGNPVVFTLTPPECYMEVRYGFGTTGTRVGGPVRVGDPLTLMINMRSQYDGFDIVVNDCYAHNGATKRIQLIDHYGCPVDSKLMSPFRGTWAHTNLYETQVYAYLKTFRFTGSPALYIECDVRMCHGQCPAQPCYWRNVKSIAKRSTDSQQVMITDAEKNSTLSENLSLFQALRVLQEDEDSEALKTSLDTHENVCMKTGAFTAMIGLSTFILVILTVSTMIMCFRIRRVKVIEERESAADILRPYSHHVSQPSQHSHHRHHHWSSAKPR